MMSLFRFRGEIGRLPYFLISTAALLVSYLAHYAGLRFMWDMPEAWQGFPDMDYLNYWVRFPASVVAFGALGAKGWTAETAWLIGLALLDVAIAWLLVALAVRRARAAGASLVRACLVLVPVIQIPAIIWLATRPDRSDSTAAAGAERVPLGLAFTGLLAGIVLTLVVTVASTLLLHAYGFGLFLASPFFIGLATAYLANRSVPIAAQATTRLVFGACFLGGVGLLAFAIEGLVCLAMAIPLIMLMAWIGGMVGRAIALKGARRAPGSTAMSVAVLPLLFAADIVAPPRAAFESIESIEIAATNEAVWDAIVHMGPIPEPPIAPFRWGLAYPVSGTIAGAGVGAIREGVFSTGIAYERVTVWEPGKRLEFIVLNDPPTMRELSLYDEVHAPHVRGYFRTLDARFSITPLADGRSRLTLATQHELDLNPALYWLPIARWAVHANKSRVLAHFARQAEAAVVSP